MKKQLTVTIKLYSNIAGDSNIKDYDPSTGIVLTVPGGTRLKKVLASIGVNKTSAIAYYRDGRRIGLWTTLNDSDEVSCLRLSGGG